MAKCDMNIDFEGSASGLIEKAKTAIMGAEGTFEGDDKAGNFSIPVLGSDIVGNYTISGNTFSIAITDKPMLISCRRIEDELREYNRSGEGLVTGSILSILARMNCS